MVRFRVLGPIEVWAGQTWSGIGAPKWRSLLATLLLNPGQAVSTDRLTFELWGDQPPDRAANLISVYVLRLRRLLDDPEGRVLTTRAPGYQLLLEPGDLDAGRFEALAGQGRQALNAGNFRRAAEVLIEALALWRGPALADVPPSELITAEAARLEESRLTVLEMRIEADLGCGLNSQLVPELRRLASDHPLREALWSLLIRALDAAGRRAEALAAYGQAREVIAAELGVDPGPDLQRLYQVMLTANALTAPASPDTASPAAAANEPYAGAAAPRPADAPRHRTPAAPRQVPAQLPADVPDFTNREIHLDRLLRLVHEARERENPAVPVAVIAGTPGLGKTAFAVHAAHALRQEFPDGQLYVNLLGGSERPAPADEVLARFLRDLGVDGARVPVDAEERAAMYRTRLAGKQTLVLLDDARQAAQVRPLLPGTGSCAVIVTSRRRLSDLAGSSLVDLDVLDDGKAAELFTRIIGPERAEAEAEAVREVLAICAGLPLAIRIAGARLAARPGWSVRTLADRLSDQRHRMDEFSTGDLAVRTAFHVSFDSLRAERHDDVDPAHAFRLLGVWQGPSISLQAATALIGQPQPQAAAALETLVDAHLLESLTPDRYQFHDLLRDYAAERAQSDESPQAIESAVRRLFMWYLHTADAAASVVSPHRDRVPLDPPEPDSGAAGFASAEQALTWCEQERANLVAAVRQAAQYDMHDIAWKLPVAAMVGFDFHGHRSEWITTHQIGLAGARQLGDRRAEAWVLNNLGMVFSQQRDDKATEYFERAMAIHRASGDRRGEAQAANNLAYHYRFMDRYEEAAAALLDALQLQRQVGLRYGESIALCNLGETYLELGRHDDAVARSQEALGVIREIGSDRLEGYALYNLGRVDLNLGHTAEAVELLSRAMELHRTVGDRYGEAHDLRYLGEAYAQAGQLTAARDSWRRARSLFASLNEDGQAAEIGAKLQKMLPAI
jgi:DNA-binding SARP family transcriptional activator/Tfp pilus assembly protein PilF